MSRSVSRSTTVSAQPGTVFALLAAPRRHPEFDGSGSVKRQLQGPEQLHLGARFGMRMHLLAPYVITNTVVEFEQDRQIAWRHFGHHIWRYTLEPVQGGTRITETFDWSRARSPQVLELLRAPERNAVSIDRTLTRLAERFGTAT